jgi:hypothetical protein
MAKWGSTKRISYKNHKNASLFDFEPLVNSKDGVYLMPCCLPCGKVGGLQIRRCQGFAVDLDLLRLFTLGALALKPSDFCNVMVHTRVCASGLHIEKLIKIE